MPDALWLLIGLLVGYGLAEWRQRFAMESAQKVNAAATTSASVMLAASDSQTKLAANVSALTAGVNQLESMVTGKLTKLAEVVDDLDRSQGTVINGLVNAHIIGVAARGPSERPTQVGEGPGSMPPRVDQRVPPLGGDEEPLLR